jgi:hypothetical protein
MADRTGRISGTFTLAQIEAAIQFQEAQSFEFLTSRIESGTDNLADFKKLPLGEFPKELKLTFSSATAPSGFSKIWEGEMFVGGEPGDVIAWRSAKLRDDTRKGDDHGPRVK